VRASALALALVTLLAAGGGAADRDAPLAVGEQAPDLVLGDQHGRPFKLSDALARRDFVIVAFYVKAFTKG
jgi:hypothetical protein